LKFFPRKGAKVASCPESNLKLGSGIAPIPMMLSAGLCVALGTDGPASNNDLDLLSEMRTTSLIHKGLAEDPATISAKDVFTMATENGALASQFL
jgi:5-methylthioadenosine/S-adenosylhomocysteine deaminase